ncbi:MAG: arylsulfatase [Planctomycetota bacterium]|nr:arylsulfatase [Planctomycetaceae bacterium]MDQ3329762.1 arylsulfatase [Planctomycetota bacterium]
MKRFVSLAVLVLLVTPRLDAADQPNIVVILSDDMGWSDLGCYGGELETPNLDALAKGGLRFTQFYNTARCCPTRASLLTGLYPHQAGVGHMMEDRGHSGYRGDLNDSCVTTAEVLKPAGYGTYAVGKWHVTKHAKPEGPKFNWPVNRGFDHYYGTIHGAGSFFDPSSLTRDDSQISPFADPEYKPETYYYTNAITDHAVKFINEHDKATPDKPLFMYVAHTCAHWPMHALPEDIERFKGKFDTGYGLAREARYERLKKMGMIDPNWELSPQAKDWDDVEAVEWEKRCMEVYAAMIYRMDAGIGEIVTSLKDTGRLDDTLILFMQDNGGCAEDMGRKGNESHPDIPRPEKPTLPPIAAADFINGGSVPNQTRDGYPVRMGTNAMPGPADTYVGYGEGWANVSNTPFRLYKHYVHEGGISTPLIAHWPKGINRHGELEKQPGHLIDVMATCVDIAGATYPMERNGKKITPAEGRSLVPAFKGETIDREAIYWEHEGNRAIRVGDWKLVATSEKGAWELYDLAKDRTEMHDLANKHPEKVKELAAKWDAYAKRANVLPYGGWRGNSDASASFSKKRRFSLDGDAALSREQSPNIAKRGFTVAVTIVKPGRNGVLVSQGGAARGWVLYQQDGTVNFLVRNKDRTRLLSSAPLAAEPKTISATLSKQQLALSVDGKTLVASPAFELVGEMPVDGLEVGRDTKGVIGDYAGPFPFDGKIESVAIELAR